MKPSCLLTLLSKHRFYSFFSYAPNTYQNENRMEARQTTGVLTFFVKHISVTHA